MSVYEIIFSPTGGTKKVADIITDKLCSEKTIIDLTDIKTDFSQFSFDENDVCVVAVPSYGGRVPDIALSRLSKMKSLSAKAVLLVVYGNRDYDDTLLELKEALTSMNFSCVAAVTAIAKHSVVTQIAAERPDNNDIKVLQEFAQTINEHISTADLSSILMVPGNNPYKKYTGIPLKPHATKSCTKCGICAELCPIGAILPHSDKTDEDKCISCMRCMSVCPNDARKLNCILLSVASSKLTKACSTYRENELFLSKNN